MKPRYLLVFGFLFALLLPLSSFAGYLDLTENYTLSAAKTVRGNLYVGASSALISGTIQGDLIVAGADVLLGGPIGGDGLIAGGSVRSTSAVAGDLRVAGGTVIVLEDVAGDLVMLAGDGTFSSSARVGKDAIIIGGTVKLLGAVDGTAYLAGGDILVDGHVKGKVKVVNARTVTIGPHAIIDGEFYYISPEQAVISEGAVISGGIKHEYTNPFISAPDARGFFMGLFGIAFIVRLLVLLSTTLFFVLVFRRLSTDVVNRSLVSFWKSMFSGLGLMLALPIGAVLLITTVLGSILGVFAFAVWVAFLMLAQIYGGVLLAAWFSVHVLKHDKPKVISWVSALLGVLALNIVLLVPFVGVVVCAAFMFSAYGALAAIFYKHFFVGR